VQDLRLAFRTLFRRPGLSAVAVATLAIGIGANASMFSVINAVLLAPLPFDRPDELVILTESTPTFPAVSVTRYNYEDWRGRSRSFAGMEAFRPLNVTVTGTGEPERVPAKMLSAGLLPLLGVSPEDGRGFGAADDRAGAEGVVVLSAGFAARKFPSQRAVGRTLLLDSEPYTVVGILPARFELFQPADVYMPLGPWAATLPEDRGWHPGIFPVARLREGISLERARSEMDDISRRLEAEFPDANTDVRALVTRLEDQLVQNVRPALLMLLGAVTLVLLIACANVANLLLARAVGRQKEIAVRIALGAGRLRIVRQLLVESVVLACVGGAAGLLAASWGIAFLNAAAAAVLPRAHAISLAWPVVFFALGTSVATGLLFGLAPALHATGFDVRRSLNEEGRGSGTGARQRRMRSALVVVEVGLALVLLVGAGLLLRSFASLTSVPPGFDADRLLVINLPLSPAAYADDDGVRASTVDRIVRRVRAVPGVTSAGMTTALPMAGAGATIHFNRASAPPEKPGDYVMAGLRAVTPQYLSTLGVPLRRGRPIQEGDTAASARVVVINESMAAQFFPDRDPIGERIQLGTEPAPDLPWMEIVGIVGDMKQSFDAGAKSEMFVPYAQHPDPQLRGLYLNTALVVRTATEPTAVVSSIRAALREIDPRQPLVNVRTMATSMAGTVAQPRLQMVLLIVFAIMAVLLAAVGVYGLMAYTVTQRIPEIGVRMAVGASPGRVIRMVVWQGARLALLGLALGIVAAGFAARAVENLLFGVRGLDPLTFGGAAAVLVAATLVATYVPARRAARISPLAALGRLAP
jgi:putative ABC transport system permease protein